MPETWGPVLLGIVALAILLYGFSKTAMPVAGVVAGPMLAAALGPTVAAGFAVPLLILGDLMGLVYFRQHANWRLMLKIVPGVLVGFVITALLFAFASTTLIARVIGVLLLLSVGLELLRRRTDEVREVESTAGVRRLEVGFYGTLTGVTTMAANSGGAALSLYLIKMRVPMLAFMGTSVWFFFILNLIKLPIIIPLGLITRESLVSNLLFAPLIIVGALIGIATFRRMNQVWFDRIALALSALASLWLVLHG
ncbi:MAG: sulfite exporter TauE/SafE family protein [Actinomycetota bacterium]|nr:sulfite exporter TauE/SafE family protein [Actinomycetota bacterium]